MNASEIVEVLEEEEDKECEDWCFICKDGGELMLCDYKDCPKVYHERCVENDISRKGNEDSLVCRWHKCYLCNKNPKLYCYCCPHAVCDGCVTHAEFVRLKDDKGLCNQCEEYVFALEEIQEYDAAGDKIDLKDRNTFECLFLEYWELVKEQEELTFDDVRNSKSKKKGVKSKYKDDPKYTLADDDSKPRKRSVKAKRYKDDDPKFSLSNHAVEEDVEEDYKTVSKRKGMEYIGWGSKPLIDFLTSIGEETKEAMSQLSVESVIRRYIRQENLLDREKKKKVCCDEKLFSIFRKKSVHHNKIFKLLETHFKENVEQLEFLTRLERGFGEETKKNVLTPCKKQKTEERSDEKKTREKEKETKPEMRATGFALISADNLKRVYLRKSLIVELLKKEKEGFEGKVLGSFVKVKNDPRDSMAYQIMQVTGIGSVADPSEGMLLYAATREVRISKLEDSDISKEEIEDLKQKVSNGLLRQPTVVEMEEKAKALHEDITKHWIARQLNVLQKRINFANEKGWKKELEEYLEQRELLEKPSEQERLLRETPRIIEELVEIKPERATSSDSSRQGNINGLSEEPVINID